jgi:hypothetical protein
MHSPHYRRVGLLAAGSLLLTGLGAAGAFAADPQTSSTIADSSGWYTQAYENFDTGGYLTPQQTDVTGPQRAPFGTSSHKITVGESSAQTELYRTNAYDGVPVAALTRLEYSELARPSTGTAFRQPVYLRLSVDTNNDGKTDTSLFFYPANNGTVVDGQWQNWDVSGGKIDVNGDNGGTTTLAIWAGNHPGAKLVNDKFDPNHDAGALALIAGGGLGGSTDSQTNGEYFVDRVIVGDNNTDTLYDLGGNTTVAGQNTDLTVDPAHAQGWQHQAYDDNVYLNSNQTFVDGPAIPPSGGGSLRFSLTSAENPARVELFRTTQYDDTLLRDVRSIRYSTFTQADASNSTPQQPVYMRLSLDTDGNGTTDDTLYFFPANNGSVQQGTWQTWDAGNGVWGVNGDPGKAKSVTLDQYLVAHPDARIVANADSSAPTQPHGGTAFLVGGGGAGQMNGQYFLDNITMATADAASGHVVTGTHLDLEPTLPSISIGNASVSEGNHGATLTFPVTLSRPVVRATTVHFSTADGTTNHPALAGSDYRAKSGTVTIPAGSTSATVSVSVVSDMVREANETMRVNLSDPVNATIANGTAVGTILNDDTQVGIAVRQGTQHRIRVIVTTGPLAPGAPVKVYRVLPSGRRVVLTATLGTNGRLSVRLGHHYAPGTRVRLVAVVQTANGLYSSGQVAITIR